MGYKFSKVLISFNSQLTKFTQFVFKTAVSNFENWLFLSNIIDKQLVDFPLNNRTEIILE